VRAAKERRVAHAALNSALHCLSISQPTLLPPSVPDLLRVAADMTGPRPWWRFW
jgi:hypothetical protein